MKQLLLAMQQYEDVHGRLPLAALCDNHGSPLLSWRVLLLPHLEHEELYRQFRLDEPWDSAHNRTLLQRMPTVYATPPNMPVNVEAEPFTTYYQVFVGNGTAFENRIRVASLLDFPDGASRTALIVEAGNAVPWTKPVDLAYDEHQPLPPLGGIFTGKRRFNLFEPDRVKGFHIGLADGYVRFVKSEISEETLRALITRNDGRLLGSDW